MTALTEFPPIVQRLVKAYDSKDKSECEGAPSRLAPLFAGSAKFKGTSWLKAIQVCCGDIRDYFKGVVQGRATQHLVIDEVSTDAKGRFVLTAKFTSRAEDYTPNPDKPVTITLGTNDKGHIDFFESTPR